MPINQVVVISANPKSGAYDRLSLVDELRKSIETAGYRCELHTDLAQMSQRAKTLTDEGVLRTVVAAGGDGTAAMVASLIPFGVPLTLFPTGSENLLAKHLSVTADVASCTSAIRKLRTKDLDVMMVNERLSLLMASVGFDAEVVRRVHQTRRSHITRWSYWWAILNSLVHYRWPDLRIEIRDDRDQIVEETIGSWIFIFNVPRYAAGLSIIDDAIEDDGYLDVGVFGRGGLIQGLWCYWAVVRGNHHQLKQWRRFRARSIKIESTGSKNLTQNRKHSVVASCQTDGDWACELPVTIRISDRKLAIVV
jgi:diacylglycerol kinase (ATP)